MLAKTVWVLACAIPESMLCGLSWLNLCDVGLCTRGRLVSVTQQVPSGLKLEKMEAQSSHSFACVSLQHIFCRSCSELCIFSITQALGHPSSVRRKDCHCPPAVPLTTFKPVATTAGVAAEADWLLWAVPPQSWGRVSARHVSLSGKLVHTEQPGC